MKAHVRVPACNKAFLFLAISIKFYDNLQLLLSTMAVDIAQSCNFHFKGEF
jgi:hypothetical protein